MAAQHHDVCRCWFDRRLQPGSFALCRARSKRLVGIKNLDIYAVALFVDPTAVHSALGGHFRGASCPEALARDQALFDGGCGGWDAQDAAPWLARRAS